jgi:hypothetical protein
MLLDVEPSALIPLAVVRQRAERLTDEALALLRLSLKNTPSFYSTHAALDQVIDSVEFRGSLPDWAKWAQAARALSWHAKSEARCGAHTEHVQLLERCGCYAQLASDALLDLCKVETSEYTSQRVHGDAATADGRSR